MEDLDLIYRQHAQTVYRFLLAKTGSADLAEELTQETFFQSAASAGMMEAAKSAPGFAELRRTCSIPTIKVKGTKPSVLTT